MKKGIRYLLNSEAFVTIYDRRMNGEDSHLSVVLSIEGKTIEVICSKESVFRNGLYSYFTYAVKKINQKADKRYELIKAFAIKRNKNIPADKRSFQMRDANCITIYKHLKTGLVER
ncbi:hypothetical protein [Colwellia sp. MT41]|uniref:hypothetical protein n=1 Tax=Colwellia sp. MT41 TaxID=58049 RepID=UPI000A4656D4|nr:hypothetical protein [Colwellia sp. MT41]